jgi:hypothetical protein
MSGHVDTDHPAARPDLVHGDEAVEPATGAQVE